MVRHFATAVASCALPSRMMRLGFEAARSASLAGERSRAMQVWPWASAALRAKLPQPVEAPKKVMVFDMVVNGLVVVERLMTKFRQDGVGKLVLL